MRATSASLAKWGTNDSKCLVRRGSQWETNIWGMLASLFCVSCFRGPSNDIFTVRERRLNGRVGRIFKTAGMRRNPQRPPTGTEQLRRADNHFLFVTQVKSFKLVILLIYCEILDFEKIEFRALFQSWNLQLFWGPTKIGKKFYQLVKNSRQTRQSSPTLVEVSERLVHWFPSYRFFLRRMKRPLAPVLKRPRQKNYYCHILSSTVLKF